MQWLWWFQHRRQKGVRVELLGGLNLVGGLQLLVAIMNVEHQARDDVGLEGDSEGAQNVIDHAKEWEGHGNKPDDGTCKSQATSRHVNPAYRYQDKSHLSNENLVFLPG